ncbi:MULTISPECIES: SDR family NAD(P)-dependent oxidoreductase [Paenibacillus]|uniref:3-oxoacyl-ACP reductase n=1 Tax=Paenibacillus naphthalenovorans TaxID=162209 RepID=A0A0U2W1B4_9BACL|nr:MULTISPECIES: SDR family NAD(P)-dependent oxidoreductase [Paenibacillus]ALS21165.1 3-oxoacyl-ACP reductase [Paenibacillus naphthalenovorans]GCL71184.1 NAD(P)-dependent oxidoreductase [Paenibacillus naphthalenovorans]SDI01229.1 3-oxoacyl-[acyl-carrier protein] reductase [Paenibacillus naphthalenovorans]
MEHKPLKDKAAVVTGAARGLGRGYALRLADLGAHVVVADLDLHSFTDFEMEKNQMTGETVVEEVRQRGVRSSGYEIDVTDAKACTALMEKAMDEFGRIDIVICNAGGGAGGLTESFASRLDMVQTRRIMERNLYGTIHTCMSASPFMKQQKSGKIVTVSSIAGLQGNVDGSYAHYGAAKAGIVGYTRYLAQELGPYGIQVNCIAPGYIATGRLNVQFEKIGKEKLESDTALKRLGTVEDCANVIQFLTTGLSDYVTGQVIPVCGGLIRG